MPGASSGRPYNDRHTCASTNQGQGRPDRCRGAAPADHRREQPRTAAATPTAAAATAASKAELSSLDLHHPAEREAAPRRHAAQTARPRPGRAPRADPGDAAPTAATAATAAEPVLRHPAAEGPRGGGEAAYHHPHSRPERPPTAAATGEVVYFAFKTCQRCNNSRVFCPNFPSQQVQISLNVFLNFFHSFIQYFLTFAPPQPSPCFTHTPPHRPVPALYVPLHLRLISPHHPLPLSSFFPLHLYDVGICEGHAGRFGGVALLRRRLFLLLLVAFLLAGGVAEADL